MLLAMVVGDNGLTATKIAGKLLAVLIVMVMQQHDVGRIARYSMSRASLGSTGCRHQASFCPIFPRRTPWSSILA